jgi:hypothetical protein
LLDGRSGFLVIRSTMKKLGICGAACIAGLVFALPGVAVAREAVPLTDAQLDNITAGSFATGSGTGSAQGTVANSVAKVVTAAGANGADNATVTGQVTSSASSASSGPPANATSTLSLKVIVP